MPETPPEGAPPEEQKCEPWLPWWMPVVALVAPILSGAWQGATSDSDVLKAVLWGMVWPGLPLYVGLIVLFWGAWKIELE